MMARVCILSLAVLSGCMKSPLDGYWVPQRPLGSNVPAYRPPLEPPTNHADDTGNAAPSIAPDPQGELTLQQAWRLALMRHPGMIADAYEVRAAEAQRLQADMLPNPELDVRLDDFGGSGSRRDFNTSEVRVRLTQLIELGDKRARRVALAQSERDLAAWDYEARRVDLAAQVSGRYVAVLESQQRVELRREAVGIAQDMHKIVEDRVAAGGLLPIHKDHSLVRLDVARLDLREAELQLRAARQQLAASWNSDKVSFDRVAGVLEPAPGPLPEFGPLNAELHHHPLVARTASLLAQRQADLELARADAVPDVTLGVGTRYFRDGDNHAFLVELSIPLPLFDRNQGTILQKRFGLAKARAEVDNAMLEARDTLISAHRDLAIAHQRAADLSKEVLPRLQAILETTRAQFKQGSLKLDDMLDADRDLLRAKVSLLDALGTYHSAAAIIEGLIGKPLAQVELR